MRVIFPSVWVLLGVLSPRARAQVGPSDPPEQESRTDGHYRPGPPFLQLPVFLHSRVPLLDRAELSPVRAPGFARLPQRMREVLVPIPELSRPVGIESGPSRLRVACSSKQMRVKVSRETPGSVDAFRLGTCAASWSTEQHLYFRYELHQCGTRTQIINNRLVYSNTLHYTPDETQGSTESSSAFSIPVQCHFNRFHYSYKIGYVPHVQTQRLFKPIKPQGGIRLTPHDAQWNRLDPTEGYVIGRPMYFEAEVGSVSEGERLFVHSCHVTINTSHLSTPRVAIIDNYGCMIDSKSTIGSRFIQSSRRNAVRFSVDAFVLKGKQAKHLYMHCELSVSSESPTETSKFCSYNQTKDSWEELYGANAVCSCCNATCLPGAPSDGGLLNKDELELHSVKEKQQLLFISTSRNSFLQDAEKTIPAAARGETSGTRLMVVDEYIRGRESVEIVLDTSKAEPPPTAPRTEAEEPRRIFEKVFGLD